LKTQIEEKVVEKNPKTSLKKNGYDSNSRQKLKSDDKKENEKSLSAKKPNNYDKKL
jgi:hypothetical protein